MPKQPPPEYAVVRVRVTRDNYGKCNCTPLRADGSPMMVDPPEWARWKGAAPPTAERFRCEARDLAFVPADGLFAGVSP